MKLRLALWLAYKIGGRDFYAWREQCLRIGAAYERERIIKKIVEAFLTPSSKVSLYIQTEDDLRTWIGKGENK